MIIGDTMAKLDSGEYDAAQLRQTLLYTLVCHRPAIEPQQAIDAACMPPGTSGGWQFVPKSDLPEDWDGDDDTYPSPCPKHTSTHVHSLAVC